MFCKKKIKSFLIKIINENLLLVKRLREPRIQIVLSTVIGVIYLAQFNREFLIIFIKFMVFNKRMSSSVCLLRPMAYYRE